MGNGPDLQQAIKDKSVDEQALQAEIDRVRNTMNNTEDMAIDYINSHTDGVIMAADSNSPEITFINNQSYTKFSEEYSLAALDAVIDQTIETAKDGMKVAASEGSDPGAVLALVGSIGGLIKSGLALAASSSTTTTKLTVTFSQFNVEDKDYAVYSAVNSGVVKGSDAWGMKDLTLVAQVTIVARVKADPNLTYQEKLQADLNQITELNKLYNSEVKDSLIKGTPNDKALKRVKRYIDAAEAEVQRDRERLQASNEKAKQKSQDPA